MRFRLLGPLTVEGDGATVPLGGVKQRAALGCLLLNANRVVASSTLLRALWSDGNRPASARKILHNAVWRLRTTLEPAPGSCVPRLETCAPGYLLHVDPAEVDLLRFRDLVAEGRARMAAGDPRAAAPLLRDALRLWRGPVLADLVEQGLSWPELDAVNESRFDAQEDWFDAELACGRHHAVLGELRALVNGGALRERACGQLMLALYRCGRQAEALEVYSRMRAALIDQLGLEPGQDLRRLQRAILNHDPSLAAPVPALAATGPTAPAATGLAPAAAPANVRETEVAHQVQPALTRPAPAVAVLGPGHQGRAGRPVPRRAPGVPALLPVQRGVVRRDVSVLMVRGAPAEGTDPERLDEILAETAAGVRAEVERAGGVVATSIGSTSLAVFGLAGPDVDDAERAVRAAVAMRDRFGPGIAVRAAVTTGALRLAAADAVPTAVTGVLVEQCQLLLAGTALGEVRVCGETRRATEGIAVYRRVNGFDDCWSVRALPSSPPVPDSVPLVDRDSELALVAGLVERAGHRARPHLVTVLGEARTGKTRFLAEVGRRFRAVALPVAESPLAVHTALLAARCGIAPDDAPPTARAKLTAALGDRLPDAGELVEQLLPLFGDDTAQPMRAVPAAWWRVVRHLHRDAPLVVTVDDLHDADDALLDEVRDLLDAPFPVPLCLVVGARPGLLDRRPDWGGGAAHAATITLEPLTDEAMDRIFEQLVSEMDGRRSESLLHVLNCCAEQDPHDRRGYLRGLLRLGQDRVPAPKAVTSG